MCGIFALINPEGCAIDLRACQAATNLLAHRGPDASGNWVSSPGDVYLGHRRLSIIDLSEAANQPMEGDKKSVIVFNGEIYNFKGLRSRLKSGGCSFRTSGDTEVILKALETWGPKCLVKLEGMFAFVLWSQEDETALVCRDFFGIKPLYYWRTPEGGLAVSSEMKSFYALPGFTAELNDEALPEYLRFRQVSGDRTLLRGVRQLQPGELALFDRRKLEMRFRSYWTPVSVLSEKSGPPHTDLTLEQFTREFTGTVERHMIADVPVGAQLSSGTDSNLICAIVRRELDRKLTAFHCHVEDAHYDETPLTDKTAARLGMEIHKIDLSEQVFFSPLLEKLTWHNDEPITHANSIGIYLISALAHGNVKVLLSGEAADEFFGGYLWYRGLMLTEWMKGKSFLRYLPAVASLGRRFSTDRLRKLIELMERSRELSDEQLINMATVSIDGFLLNRLLGADGAEEKSIEHRLALMNGGDNLDIVTRAQLFDLKTYLPSLLVRQDKMSMAASIENRVPFCTPQVLSMSLNLPPYQRCNILRGKHFLKKCLSQYLPRPQVHVKKWGFGIPLSRWLMSKVGQDLLRWTAGRESGLNGVVDISCVRDLVKNFAGDKRQADELWILISLAIWMKIFLKGKVLDFGSSHEMGNEYVAGPDLVRKS